MSIDHQGAASSRHFSCYIVGEASLTARCAEHLRAAGHRIDGVLSAHPAVAAWATEHGVALRDPGQLDATLLERPFDYLFSIANFSIISAAALRSPRRLAINFHDAPLPRYAGMHATSWAIMRGERDHGVTWHVMTEEVDAGAILKQQAVPISPEDTALTLNAKCYDAAMESFADLVIDLASDGVSSREQDLTQRTYFPFALRPPAAAVIDWQRPVSEISALVRALDFGSYPNPLDRPKIAHGPAFWICPEVEVIESPVADPPGTLLSAGPELLVIGAGDGQVRIRRLLRLDGTGLTLQEMLAEAGLEVGARLARPDALLEAATALAQRAAPHEAFWLARLHQLRAVPIPFTPPQPVESRQARAPFALPAEFVEQALGRHPGRDAAELALAVFGAYLARISGEDGQDVWFAHDGLRNREGLDRLFAAEVPIRLELGDDDTFESLGPRVLAELDRARRHGTYARTLPARHPALRTRAEQENGEGPAVGVALVDSLSTGTPPTGPLRLVLELGSGRCELRHDAAHIPAETAVRMVRHFVTLLNGVAADPAGVFRRLPMVPPEELQRLIVAPNRTAAAFPPQATIHGLFEAQAARTPDSVAVVSGDLSLTYRELDERSERLAARLRSAGVGPEVLVALLVQRSIDMVVAPLAVLKAGGAYLPLDPAHPPDRSAFLLDDSGARILLTQRAPVDGIEQGVPGQSSSLTVLYVEDTPEATPPDASVGHPAAAGGASLAYVLYTSGSTGRPKGVEITHGAVVNFLLSMAREPGLAAGDTLLAVTTLTFDIAGLELWLPLSVGARVVIAGREATLDGRQLAGVLDRCGATVMQATPVTWKLLIDAGWGGRPGFRALCGGEAMSAALADQLLERCDEVWNLYGPTETTIWSTIARVERGKPITLGHPIANTRVYLLDRAEQPVPLDVPGEIHIGGAGVARGYRGRPELTAERFTDDPFSSEPGARRYRTGDLARYREDGTLEYLGRGDFQIKLRGFRIELGEIEAILARHAGVQTAVAVAHEAGSGDKRIVAYYVPRSGTATSQAELLAHLRQHLPDYMIPGVIIPVQELALTLNGKIDRKALPAPDPASLPGRTDLVAPRTHLEDRLVKIWETVLGVPVGVTDDFFDLGGHSLAAVRMLQQVEAELGQSAAIGAFFAHPTIERVAVTLFEAAGVREVPIMQLRPGAPDITPVHFLHGDFSYGGMYAHNLARYFPGDQPVYLLPPPYPGGPGSIEAAAREAIGHIKSVQPAGPYLLLGTCNGGVVAFEAARQLAAAGEQVLDVVVVNASGRNSMLAPVELFVRAVARARNMNEAERAALFLNLRERVLRHLATAKARGITGVPAIGGYLVLRGLRRALRRFAAGAPGPRAIDPPEEGPPLHYRDRVISRMVDAYVPRRYHGRMTLILCHQDVNEHLPDPTAGWGRVVRQIEALAVPGDHHDSLVRHASALGGAIAGTLGAAQERRQAAMDSGADSAAA
jgi:amino acid adenylation domain-containing protein